MEKKARMTRTQSEREIDILPSNEEFMQKTNTKIVFRNGFNPSKAIKNQVSSK